MRTRLACLLVGATLLTPAAAFGQSAGDEQYEDPFAPEPAQTESGGSGDDEPAAGGGAPEPAAAPAPAPAPGMPEPTAPEPAVVTAQAPVSGGEQLAYTGADEGLLALAGVVMLAGGVALRLRLRR